MCYEVLVNAHCNQISVFVTDEKQEAAQGSDDYFLSSADKVHFFLEPGAVDPATGTRIPVEARNGAWTSPETAEVLTDVCSHHQNLQFVMVENNAYQESIIDWVKKGKQDFPWWMKIEAHTTGRNKADPQFGLPGIEVEFANKAWAWPAGEWEGHPPGCTCSWCVLKREFSLFPKYSTTDGVMSCLFAKTAIDKWGAVRRGPRERRDWNRR